MNIEEARAQFIPAVEEILDDCRFDDLVDKDRFQIMMATIQMRPDLRARY